MATETREVNNFHRVHMQDFGMLEIAQGAQESLTVEADEETLKRIFTEVEDGTLTLRVDQPHPAAHSVPSDGQEPQRVGRGWLWPRHCRRPSL
jgi:hypothetical protein